MVSTKVQDIGLVSLSVECKTQCFGHVGVGEMEQHLIAFAKTRSNLLGAKRRKGCNELYFSIVHCIHLQLILFVFSGKAFFSTKI